MRIKLIFIILVGILGGCRLEALDPKKPLEQFHCETYTSKNGLPSSANSVGKIIHMPDGRLLIHTDKGLFKFDGISYDPVALKYKFLEVHHGITDFTVDNAGVIWVGGSGGLVRIDESNSRLITEADGLPVNEINCAFKDSRGTVWVVSSLNRLYMLKEGRFKRAATFDNAAIITLCEDRNGNIWAGDWSGMLYVGRGFEFRKLTLPVLQGIRNLSQVFFDKHNTMWFAGDNDLAVIHPDTEGGSEYGKGKIRFYSNNDGFIVNNAFSICEDVHGNLWFAGMGGVNRVCPIPGKTGEYRFDKLYEGSSMISVFEDREKSIWIGSVCEGMMQLRDTTFRTYSREQGVSIRAHSLYITPGGEILLGTPLGHILRFENEKFSPVHSIGNSVNMTITGMVMDKSGALWVGTIFSGLYRIRGNQTEAFTMKNGFPDDFILTVITDSSGRLWAGTVKGGLVGRENNMFHTYNMRDGLPGGSVYYILEDRSKNILVGTGNGLAIIKEGRIVPGNIRVYLEGIPVSAVYEDAHVDGLYWISTHEHGLARLNINKKSPPVFFTAANGLGTDAVYQLMEDNWGNLWISSHEGILKVNKYQLNEFAGEKAPAVQCTVFGFADGLQSLYSHKIGNNTVIKTPNGEFWFSTQNGVSAVNPSKEVINKIPPPVFIKKVEKNNILLDQRKELQRLMDCQRIGFTVSVPSFINPSNIQVKYRLEGYEETWHLISGSSQRDIEYWDLPFGVYRLRVLAANSNGTWNHEGVSFSFILEPHFYQTLLFKIIVIVLLGSVLVVFLVGGKRYLYMRKLRNKYKNSTLDPEKVESYLKKLNYLMDIEKLYKDEELSLQKMAEKLRISTRDLSRIINERLGKNFRDFVNGYRVDEVKKMIMNPKKNLPLLDIAFEVGFNSKEVFNRAFKKYTGMTPSDYKKVNSKNI